MTIRAVDLAAYQRAARALLVHGLVTAARPGAAELGLVRRWARELDRDLAALGGYAVVVRPRAVVLVRPLDLLDATQRLHGGSGRPFDRLRYAVLALVLAVLERAGVQITLSDLSARVRRAAADVPGLTFDPDVFQSRQAFAHVVRWLEGVGVLWLTDGSLRQWEESTHDGEALYDVDRDVARLLFQPAQPLHGAGSVAGLLYAPPVGVGRDALRKGRRQRLVRLLLERPVVYFDDLGDELAAYARREARALGAELEALTGARLERRREGLALIASERFSDVPFPRGGGPDQAALLLVDRIAEGIDGADPVARPSLVGRSAELARGLDAAAPDEVRGEGGGAAEAGAPQGDAPFLPDAWLEAAAVEIVEACGPGLKAAYRDDPLELVAEGVERLVWFDLARRVPGGIVVLPALARYRGVTVRARDVALPQLGLFGGTA